MHDGGIAGVQGVLPAAGAGAFQRVRFSAEPGQVRAGARGRAAVERPLQPA